MNNCKKKQVNWSRLLLRFMLLLNMLLIVVNVFLTFVLPDWKSSVEIWLFVIAVGSLILVVPLLFVAAHLERCRIPEEQAKAVSQWKRARLRNLASGWPLPARIVEIHHLDEEK